MFVNCPRYTLLEKIAARGYNNFTIRNLNYIQYICWCFSSEDSLEWGHPWCYPGVPRIHHWVSWWHQCEG